MGFWASVLANVVAIVIILGAWLLICLVCYLWPGHGIDDDERVDSPTRFWIRKTG